MKKSRTGIITAVLSLFLLLSVAAVPVFAAGGTSAVDENAEYLSTVIDDAGILQDAQLISLNEKIRSASDETGLNLCVVISGFDLTDADTETWTDSFYDSHYGPDTDGIIYYLDLSLSGTAYDYISTSGKAILLYKNEYDSMFTDLDPYLPHSGQIPEPDQIYMAVSEIIDLFVKYGDEKPGFWDYGYDPGTDKYVYYRNGKTIISKKAPAPVMLTRLIIPFFLGCIAAAIFFFTVRKHYVFKPSHNSRTYVSGNDTHFTQSEDRFVNSYVTHVRIDNSTSGGSGGGSHSSGGGGGSHGGGGHHR